jgi:hypothetical protein
VANVTGHHIYRGAVGSNGPVVVGFTGYSGSVTILPLSVAAEIIANPAGF